MNRADQTRFVAPQKYELDLFYLQGKSLLPTILVITIYVVTYEMKFGCQVEILSVQHGEVTAKVDGNGFCGTLVVDRRDERKRRR